MEYDIHSRTLNFAVCIYKTSSKLNNRGLEDYKQQLARSAASIGANYAEAVGTHSKKDFAAKISICKREAQESLFWLKLLDEIQHDVNLDELINECQQLVKIFHTIHKSSKK